MLVARRQTDCLYWTPTQEPQIYSIPHECGRHKYFATHKKQKIITVIGGRFSPDGKSIVFTKDIDVIVMNIATREMKIIAEVDAVTCDWSPDGNRLYLINLRQSVAGEHDLDYGGGWT